jgi:hypothetical protein
MISRTGAIMENGIQYGWRKGVDYFCNISIQVEIDSGKGTKGQYMGISLGFDTPWRPVWGVVDLEITLSPY